MEFLKWTGAVLLSIVALGMVGGIVATILAVSAVLAGVSVAIMVIYLIASAIREHFS